MHTDFKKLEGTLGGWREEEPEVEAEVEVTEVVEEEVKGI